MNHFIEWCNKLEHALLTLDQKEAENIIKEVHKTTSSDKIAGELIAPTLVNIGNSWERGDLSLSQIYMSGIMCEKLIDVILPPKSEFRKNQPKMAIAVVEDFHLLGKRIVHASLRASGYEIQDLGGGMRIERIAEIVRTEGIKILLLSVLMLPSALRIKELKKLLKDIDVTIVVGGAPFRFDDKLWKEVGADYFGKDSSDAIEIINKIMEERK